MTGLGEQIAARADAEIKRLVNDFGTEYIALVEKLYGRAELQEMARTSEIDPEFLAAQLAGMGVGKALANYPGPPQCSEVLIQQLLGRWTIEFNKRRKT